MINEDTEQNKELIPRPPIVVVLGHVDHGKTTLLDYIRKTKVAEKEAGGITQHIGAYEITIQPKASVQSKKEEILHSVQDNFVPVGHKITFLDTPGHEAFSQIRSRGAKAADIALLVIAADEGIKPQTKESLELIKEAEIPFIVVLTKIDKEGANPEKIKNDLAEIGVYVEGWGGNVPLVKVSSKTGEGIDDLLDLILLAGEIEGLKGNQQQPASGVVIESHLDSKRGIVATLIITNGTLHLKDPLITKSAKGKVKILEDFQGKSITEATFSSPVRIIGFENFPLPGEQFFVSEEDFEKEEREIKSRTLIKELGDKNSTFRIPLIIKSDTIGSSEALESVIDKLGQEKNWLFYVLKNEVGDLSEGDLKIVPKEKRTLIISFRVDKKPEIANILLANKNLILLEGEIIYEIKDKIQKVIEDKFINKPTEEVLGQLEVLAIFHPEKGNQVIGGKVISGLARNKVKVRILRNNEIINEGKIINLQKNKKDVNEVNLNEECGILIDCPQAIEKGDILEFFQKV